MFSKRYPAPAPDEKRYGVQKKGCERKIEDECVEHVSTFPNSDCILDANRLRGLRARFKPLRHRV